jgi:D-galactosamine 6-phosphate deaminase/isomerase
MNTPGSASSISAAERQRKLTGPLENWLAFVAGQGGETGALLSVVPAEQEARGYTHTLREIVQQPLTWLETASGLEGRASVLASQLARLAAPAGGSILLTGSGSSVYAGECLAPALQAALRLPVQAVSAGTLLTHPNGSLPPTGASLLVSFARSGNSPESCGVLDSVRELSPGTHHLVITCNGQGRLATSSRGDARVETVVLDDKTCDRSLVMTSSFTNMALAGRLLAFTNDLPAYRRRAESLAMLGVEMLLRHGDAIARIARSDYRSAAYLGSGCRWGAAREAALKMLEMTGGRVRSFPETYLGLRHGPMCAIDAHALVVCFLSSDPLARAYEADLIGEVNRKKLGARKVILGQNVPAGLAGEGDLVVDLADGPLLDDDAPLLDVLLGQLLAFHRCLHEGLRPDMPSDDGVINRVVEDFAIHRRG